MLPVGPVLREMLGCVSTRWGSGELLIHPLCEDLLSVGEICLEVKGCMLLPYRSLLSPRHSQPVVSINLALTGAKHSFSVQKRK